MSTLSPLDPDVAYFRDLEKAFVDRRGDPLFISNADWVFLAKLWKKGVPKRVVLRGMTDAFDAHAHSFARKQKVRSLRFCEAEISAAAVRYKRALHQGGTPRRGVSGLILKLEGLVAGSPQAPEIAADCAAAKRRLLDAAARAEQEKDFEADRVLAGIEDDLVAAAAKALGPEALATLDKASREATLVYASRMPAKVYETLIGESVRRKVLQRFGLPRLLLAEVE